MAIPSQAWTAWLDLDPLGAGASHQPLRGLEGWSLGSVLGMDVTSLSL